MPNDARQYSAYRGFRVCVRGGPDGYYGIALDPMGQWSKWSTPPLPTDVAAWSGVRRWVDEAYERESDEVLTGWQRLNW